MATKKLKKKLLVCSGCRNNSVGIQNYINTYIIELNDIKVKVNLCDSCYLARGEDI